MKWAISSAVPKVFLTIGCVLATVSVFHYNAPLEDLIDSSRLPIRTTGPPTDKPSVTFKRLRDFLFHLTNFISYTHVVIKHSPILHLRTLFSIVFS